MNDGTGPVLSLAPTATAAAEREKAPPLAKLLPVTIAMHHMVVQ